jgi:arabinose-5-phosphate isomerase
MDATVSGEVGGRAGIVPDDATVLAMARDALAHEAAAIQALAVRLDEAFLRVVRLIHASPGRVVVTGLGKSGLVGRKIAATLASTGSPALFVHAAEALHGDSGMVLADDVMIAISNSGTTEEVVAFAEMARSRGITVVAFTADAGSALGRLADEVVDISIEREADPHGLAPTASTTVTMAIGDALCVSLMVVTGFTADDFLANHPGGALGRTRATPTTAGDG